MQHESTVRRHYDELDTFYRDLWGEHLHHGLWVEGGETVEQAVCNLVDLVALRAEIGAGSRVCDVGAGYGATSRYLADTYGAEVTALTLSPVQHAYAQAHSSRRKNPTYLLGDWLAGELPTASFDAVVALESASHMADRRRFFAEAFRVLRPGGRLVACIWCAADRPARWQRRLLLGPIVRAGRLAGLDPAAAYRQWCAEAGLAVESLDDVSRQVQRTWSVCLRRLAGRLATDARYVRFLLDASRDSRGFALAVPLLWMAYRTEAMRYSVLTARKPSPSEDR